MRKIFIKIGLILSANICIAQGNYLYKIPEASELAKIKSKEEVVSTSKNLLVGTDTGIYKVSSRGASNAVWTGGNVTQIVHTDVTDQDGNLQDKWYFVTSKGIISSINLLDFAECNNGLPFLTLKKYDGKTKSLYKQPALLKDLAADPFDPNILVTATKDDVYLTRDGGQTWKSISSTSKYTAGIKAVAACHMPVYEKDGSISGTELVVFMSHSIYGFSYYRADAKKPAWTDVSAGFVALPTSTPDEVSDIVPVLCKTKDGKVYADIYCAQSFLPNIYRFDWKARKAVKVYSGTEKAATIDSLCQAKDGLFYVGVGKFGKISLGTNEALDSADQTKSWRNLLYSAGENVNTAYIPEDYTGVSALQFNELWLLKPDTCRSPYSKIADNKKAVYCSAYSVRNLQGINRYRDLIKKNKLNCLVVEMKDDSGMIHFDPKNPNVKAKDPVSQYKINFDEFVPEFKKDNVYLVARVVVFKDKNLSLYGKKQYAVWNASTGAPWIGTRGTEEVKDADGNVTGSRTLYYGENWCDPYSEDVWEYNVQIAKELIERGFDEIQFDYIRFPTDGLNLRQASYRWKDAGMDKESALVSFLRYARENINAPIGIDIYGANGWYRSSTRTGQDVELMSDYVDVICPMFYPSHFEQNFMEYAPVTERPYRIYFYGSYRNTVIGRNKIIVRPWVQAFYLGVRYDYKYYDANYVKREIFGTRDGLDRGYMYWNNSGRYQDIFPDPGDSDSPWKSSEATVHQATPAFSTAGIKAEKEAEQEAQGEKTEVKSEQKEQDKPAKAEEPSAKLNKKKAPAYGKEHDEKIISILDTVLNQEWEQGRYSNSSSDSVHKGNY